MKRFITILLLPLLLLFANAQNEPCKTCVPYQPSTTDRLGDVYPALNNSQLKNAQVAILPTDLLVLAGTVEITQKMLDEEIKNKTVSSKEKFNLLDNLSVKMLILNKAKEWAEKGKHKVAPQNLMQAYLNSLTEKLTSNDTEGKAYYNHHKTVYKGKKYATVAKKIKNMLLIRKRTAYIVKFKADLMKSTYIEINKDWLLKTIK